MLRIKQQELKQIIDDLYILINNAPVSDATKQLRYELVKADMIERPIITIGIEKGYT